MEAPECNTLGKVNQNLDCYKLRTLSDFPSFQNVLINFDYFKHV